MSKRPVFTLPATGLVMDLSGPDLTIEYDGDLVIEQTFGKTLKSARATGSLTVKLERVTGSLTAGGTLTVIGDIDADKLHGRQVVLDKQTIRARSISADERIALGPAKLTVDIIIAPEIIVDPKVSGRVTVIESLNDVGPTKIKGGFNLADYEDTLGNSDEFLSDRGLTRLEGRDRRDTPTPVPEHTDEELVEDPLSLSVEDMEPLAEQPPVVNEDLHRKLSEALVKIVGCYEGADLPPAISELRLLVDSKDYPGLRQSITEIWNGLLGYHQKRGIRPHHQVTHAFNVMHGLVQE